MILKTSKLSVGYGKKTVVADINIEILRGQFVCLLGPNGCGKSTILKTLVKMLSPLQGAVYLNERDILQMSSREMALTTAVVLTEPISPGLLTAHDVVMLGRHPHTGLMGKATDEDIRKVTEALDMVNAGNLAARYFSELSDGEKQKVLLARALAQEPQLIVLDEPTSHLDARHRIEVMLILRKLTREKGVTVIASLHDLDLAMKACDVAVLIKNDRILASGAPEDVLQEGLVAELYNMDKAVFSAVLGGVELTGGDRGPVFVVAGAGSGARVYRALTKHDFGIITGVLPENDVDFYIAKAVGANVVGSRPYDEVSAENQTDALRLMAQAKQVIDAGFPTGTANRCNVELVKTALRNNQIVHTLRSKEEAQRIYGVDDAHLTYSTNISSLVAAILSLESLVTA
jgi:iron complex transport system ATP-binding protein